jgi:hypothetical protein
MKGVGRRHKKPFFCVSGSRLPLLKAHDGPICGFGSALDSARAFPQFLYRLVANLGHDMIQSGRLSLARCRALRFLRHWLIYVPSPGDIRLRFLLGPDGRAWSWSWARLFSRGASIKALCISCHTPPAVDFGRLGGKLFKLADELVHDELAPVLFFPLEDGLAC